MATFWFNKGREGFALGEIPWASGDIRFLLVDTTLYNPASTTSDKFVAAISGISNAVIARTSAGIGSKTATDGIIDSADPVFDNVTGNQVGAWVPFLHTGNDATARLIAFVDNSGGLPFTPNGGQVTVQLDNSTNKLGKL